MRHRRGIVSGGRTAGGVTLEFFKQPVQILPVEHGGNALSHADQPGPPQGFECAPFDADIGHGLGEGQAAFEDFAHTVAFKN